MEVLHISKDTRDYKNKLKFLEGTGTNSPQILKSFVLETAVNVRKHRRLSKTKKKQDVKIRVIKSGPAKLNEENQYFSRMVRTC